jgi:hypothetical protein
MNTNLVRIVSDSKSVQGKMNWTPSVALGSFGEVTLDRCQTLEGEFGSECELRVHYPPAFLILKANYCSKITHKPMFMVFSTVYPFFL